MARMVLHPEIQLKAQQEIDMFTPTLLVQPPLCASTSINQSPTQASIVVSTTSSKEVKTGSKEIPVQCSADGGKRLMEILLGVPGPKLKKRLALSLQQSWQLEMLAPTMKVMERHGMLNGSVQES